MDELTLLSSAYGAFFLLIAVEAGLSYRRKLGYYRLGEATSNVAHGVAYQTLDVFTKGLVMVPYLAISRVAPLSLPLDAWWAWLLGLVAYDFCSYWSHRHHHEIGFLWAIHGVHHAAEDFNLAAALRQPLLQQLFKWAWTLPLALFMPVEMFVGIVVFDFLYQFVQHTRFVGKLGPLEWLMNTPSHHRVHHGTDPHYLDKNYGGIFILWDRLFGTFQAEKDEPTYGLTKPIGCLDPIWGNLHLYAELVKASKRAATTSIARAIRLWFAGPGQLDKLAPGGISQPHTPLADERLSLVSRLGLGLTLTIIVVSLTGLIIWGTEQSLSVQLGLSALVLVGLFAIGGILRHAERHARITRSSEISQM